MACAGILIVGIGYKKMIQANIFSSFGKDIVGVGKDIGKGFEDVGKDIGNLGEKALNCLEVVPTAADFAAKKAAAETAKVALDAAIALNQADPDIAKLVLANQGLETAMAGIDVTAAAGTVGVEAISELGQTVGKILASGFNLTKVEVDANVADLKAGKLPTFAMQGSVAGKSFHIKIQANIKDAGSFAKSVFEALKSAI